MKTLVILITTVVCFISCKQNRVPEEPIGHFENKRTLSVSQTEDLETWGIYKPTKIYKVDSLYVIQDNSDKEMVKIWDKKNQKVYPCIKKGNGPNEFLSISSLQIMNNELYFYDIMRKSIHKLRLADLPQITIEECRKLKVVERPFIISFNQKQDKVLASGYFKKAWLNYYDSLNNTLSSINFPEFEKTNNLSDSEKSVVYISTLMAIKPDQTRIACATQKAGVISIFSVDSDSLQEIRRWEYFPPIAKKNTTSGVTFEKDSKVGFCDIKCDEQYIYILYSGRKRKDYGLKTNHCEHLLIYDWEGNPIKQLKLEKPLFSFDYDSKENKIIGIAYEPEGCIVEYYLNELYEG